MKVEIYDTTLRDGAQGAGISYTEKDKLKIIEALDRLGVDYIEAGNMASNPKDRELYAAKLPTLKHARLAAFCITRHPNAKAEEDAGLRAVAGCPADTVTVAGKSWEYHVRRVVGTTPEENLNMIADTVSFFVKSGKHVIFDAEHFFDGYSDNPGYAMKVIETAAKAGAETVVLCDTNGGMLPDAVGVAVTSVKKRFPDLKFGIHCHNDMGMAVSAAVEAVLCGVCQVQGTVSGVGERCGNTNLNTVIPLLQLKLGYDCIGADNLKTLTSTARSVNEIMNRTFDDSEPFVGGYAFTHKAGMHIDAVRKSPRAMEHITPELVGNERNLPVSELSGRSAVIDKITSLIPSLTKDSPEVKAVLDTIKERENRGYQYENAEASLMLLIRRALGIEKKFYEVLNFQVNINESPSDSLCTALIKVRVGEKTSLKASEGNGPVNALDLALRDALSDFYPTLKDMYLSDYKVRVLDSTETTASKVRVFIETTDGVKVWNTIGVSADIIDASREALTDALDMKLYEIG